MKILYTFCLIAGAVIYGQAQTVIYSQDFETGTLPAGWSQQTLASDGGWKFGTADQLSSTYFPIPSHTEIACSNDDACNCDKSSDLLITGSLNLKDYANVFLSFDTYYYAAGETATVEASTDNGVTWTSVHDIAGISVDAWEKRYVDLSAYTGDTSVEIAFKYDDNGTWGYGWAIDNVSIYEPVPGTDLALANLLVGKEDPTPTFVGFNQYITGLPLQLKATVTNTSTQPITSFDFKWTAGDSSYTESITGINIPPLENYDVLASHSYATMAGAQPITYKITNVNGGVTELDTANNSGQFVVSGVTPDSNRKYLAEEATGAWCGWCVRGIVFMDYMKQLYPSSFVGISVHNSSSGRPDGMVLPAYNNAITSFPGFQGFPSIIINRDHIIDPSQLEQDFIANISAPPAVKLSATTLYNTGDDSLHVTVSGNFLQGLSGDYRFAAIVCEDSVHSTASSYNQTNYYSGGGNGPMDGFEDLPGTIPASQMYYDFVGRALLGNFSGTAGSLPGTITSGSSYDYSYSYAVPSDFNPAHMYVVGVVIDNATGQIMNACQTKLTVVTGIKQIEGLTSVNLFPNPAHSFCNLNFSLLSPQNVTVEVTNVLGKRVFSSDASQMSRGDHSVLLNTKSLAAGIYMVSLKTQEGSVSQKLIIE